MYGQYKKNTYTHHQRIKSSNGEVIYYKYDREHNLEEVAAKHHDRKVNSRYWQLVKRRVITDINKLYDLGEKFNNGLYFNYMALAKALGRDKLIIWRWVKEGKIPDAQFLVKSRGGSKRYYRIEEVLVLIKLFGEHHERYVDYSLKTPQGRELRDKIFKHLKVIYDKREEDGLEKYQPQI